MSSSSEQEDSQVQEDSSEEEVHSNDAAIEDDDTEDEGESEAGESEAEDSEEDPSNAKVPALDASSTESDEDDDGEEVDDDEDIPKVPKVEKSIPKIDKITQDIEEKYKKRQGRQLYIRFPEKLPESAEEFQSKVKALSELIVTANKPRQKHARFCLVDFASTQDRDKAMKKLTKNSAESKILVSLPRTDNEDFIKTLVNKKLKQIEKKREKRLLRRESKKAVKTKGYTSTIVVLNVPKSASTAQIKELFPNAVDLQVKPAPSKFSGSSIATITLPTTADARQNVKRNLSLGGTKLLIRFSNEYKKKKKNKPQKKKAEGNTEPSKGSLAPSNGNKQKNKKKKKNQKKANGEEAAEEQVPSNKATLPLSKKRDGPEDEESKVPKKKIKVATSEEAVAKAAQKNFNPMKKVDSSKVLSKKGKDSGNVKGKKFLQETGNPAPNKKGFEKKQNKQKKKKVKAVAE